MSVGQFLIIEFRDIPLISIVRKASLCSLRWLQYNKLVDFRMYKLSIWFFCHLRMKVLIPVSQCHGHFQRSMGFITSKDKILEFEIADVVNIPLDIKLRERSWYPLHL